MLTARTVAIGSRLEASDYLDGVAVAEIIDDEPVEADPNPPAVGALTQSAAPAPESASARLRELVEAQPAPVLANDERPADEWPISDAQWRRINDRLAELGVKGEGQKADRLAVMAYIVDHKVERGGHLTSTEADLILDNLAGDAGARVVRDALDPAAPTQDLPLPAADEQPAHGSTEQQLTDPWAEPPADDAADT
jgi:hypothetical protein